MSILAIPAELSGVFGLFRDSKCVFVEQAEDVREALMDIMAGRRFESRCIRRHEPNQWAFEAQPLEALEARMKQLIFELNPHCNRAGRAR